MRERRHRPRLAGTRLLLAAPILLGLLAWLGIAAAPAGAKTIHFRGETARVPAGWPVYRLAQHPRMCVRLDRRAVYLGSPAANQRCSAAAAVGRRRAILVDPAGRARARASILPVAPRPLAGASASGAPFTGLGFDACSAPSASSMAAWAKSPYRAVGVYIGGINRACAQPNLTASWVSAQTAAGWHLIPTYVGRQAPTSSCGSCAKLSTAQATAQGAAAAEDAVARAEAVAIGPGSPIYFDMESYSRTSSATAATLTFLEAWTRKLHALGYVSGVYSSSASGIADLAARIGSGYLQPDDLWIANWNGQQSTAEPVLPASAWAQHQRIHQYRGGHDERYGGVTINIDNNYVDGATVGDATLPTSPDDPVGWLDSAGAPGPGQVRVRGWAFDPDVPTATLDIRVSVGGREGDSEASVYDLGPIANQPRNGVAIEHPEAGKYHGFDASFFAGTAGKQTICVYAGNTGLGSDRLLGCKAKWIPVAISLRHIHTTSRGVRVRVECEWPEGTECPGQLQLRTRFKKRMGRRHGRVRVHTVTRNLGRRSFHLGGDRGHGFLIPFSAGGKTLLRGRGKLRTYLIAAVPGGRRVRVIGVENKG